MAALLAVAAGLAGVAYASWPLLGARPLRDLSESPRVWDADVLQAEANALRAWSVAAGERQADAVATVPPALQGGDVR
jgi:hypothetical protein